MWKNVGLFDVRTLKLVEISSFALNRSESFMEQVF